MERQNIWQYFALGKRFFINFASMKLKQSYSKVCLAVMLAGGLGLLSSCHDKKKADSDIIAKKPVAVKKKSTQKVGDYSQKRDIDWLGSHYTISMVRKADEALPLVADEQGNKYFDNRIVVTINRADGSQFFSHTFVKSDFAKCLNNSFGRNGALLGVVFNETKGDCLYFAASVGSPDIMSDSFVPIVVRVTRTGSMSIYEDTQLDTSSNENAADNVMDEDEGV